jgi:ApaG protein
VSDATTEGIRVQVRSVYLSERSAPQRGEYLFAYTVRISNVGNDTAQLVSREWIITDGLGRVERVAGPGVVGQQPLIVPGQSFEYTSFCPLPTPVGSMHGSYRMQRPDGRSFDARIAPFSLAVPTALN